MSIRVFCDVMPCELVAITFRKNLLLHSHGRQMTPVPCRQCWRCHMSYNNAVYYKRGSSRGIFFYIKHCL